MLQGSHGERKRKKQILGDQKLQGRLLEGYEIAERRGLACLLKEYQHIVMRHMKQQRRQELCATGAMVTTGEDVDLEVRYEQMRISPLLLHAAQNMTYEGMCSLSDDGRRFRKAFWDDLCRYSALLLEAGAAGLDGHDDLSKHQEFLGASHAHLEVTEQFARSKATTKRLIGKQAISKQQEVTQAQMNCLKFY